MSYVRQNVRQKSSKPMTMTKAFLKMKADASQKFVKKVSPLTISSSPSDLAHRTQAAIF